MPGYVNPYTIPNRKKLGKEYPEFGRQIGMHVEKKNEELGKILASLMKTKKKRIKTRPNRLRMLQALLGLNPMGNQTLPPSMNDPANFGYAGGVLGGTGAPPGAPSSIYGDIASMGNPMGGLPLSTLQATDNLQEPDQYGYRPSDIQGMLEDQRARDMAGLYPAQSSGVWQPMNTSPMRPMPHPGTTLGPVSNWELDPFGPARTQRDFYI